MELELSPDEEFFASTTRRFLDERSDHRGDPWDAATTRCGFVADYWKQGAELGWTSLLVSEADGGGTISGRPLGDLALVAYAFGRHAAPGPLVPASLVAGASVALGNRRAEGVGPQWAAGGEVIAAWCYGAPRPHTTSATSRSSWCRAATGSASPA